MTEPSAVAGSEPRPSGGREDGDSLQPKRTRTSAAWTLVGAALLTLLLALIFIIQNSQDIDLEFLWFDFRLPVGAAFVLAMVLGGLLVAALGAARVVQLRLAARRHRVGHRGRKRRSRASVG